jgi:hypothetical protein
MMLQIEPMALPIVNEMLGANLPRSNRNFQHAVGTIAEESACPLRLGKLGESFPLGVELVF